MASCDLAVAEDGTRFGVNGVNIGLLLHAHGGAVAQCAAEARVRGAGDGRIPDQLEQARNAGLINRIAAKGELEAETMTLANLIAKLGSAVKIGKEAFYKQIEMLVADAYGDTGAVMVENTAHTDTAEGVQAFLENATQSGVLSARPICDDQRTERCGLAIRAFALSSMKCAHVGTFA